MEHKVYTGVSANFDSGWINTLEDPILFFTLTEGNELQFLVKISENIDLYSTRVV